jgi:hypothetical protein
MQISLAALKAAEPALVKILSFDSLDVKTSYWLGRLVKTLTSELSHYRNEEMKLWNKFGTEDEQEKGKINVPLENQVEFFKATDELGRVEVELKFEPIGLDKLEGCKLSAFEMASVDAFIVAPDAETEKTAHA